ncbi:MAG: DUF3084 domain-containing protein [Armatimonadota bacterium]
MPLYTIIVFVALGLLGALIAYLGDVIGARLGKRRSTIFGLRPRQSARLVAAVIGGLLPLLGLGVATVGSRYARTAVFELHSLFDQRQQLETQVESLQEDVKLHERRAESAEEAAEELKAIQQEQHERIEGLQAREDELQTRAAGLEERVGGLSGRVDTLVARRDQLTSDLAEAQEDLQRSQADLQGARERLDITEDELLAKEREVEQKLRQVENIGNQLDVVSRELDSAIRELEPAQQELQATHEELTEREEELRELEARLQQVMSHHELVSKRPDVLFEPWDELLRVVQSANRTQDQVVADLFEWLHLASSAVEARGVPEGENGRAIILTAPPPEGMEPGEASERQIVESVASLLREAGPDEWVVMIRVYRRYFRGDETQVAVALKATPNELEFHEGEVLDEFVLQSTIHELDAITTLWHRITDDDSPVRARAIAEGMLPRPNTTTYGSIDLASIYRAAQEIRGGSGRMLVQLRAASDTYTRGPLELKIDVRPVEEPS